jgi:hypothetical protein
MSCRLAHREPQPRQEQLAVLPISVGNDARYHKKSNRAQSLYDLPRLVEPEEMVSPLLCVVSPAADNVSGGNFDANLSGIRHCPRLKSPAAPAALPA